MIKKQKILYPYFAKYFLKKNLYILITYYVYIIK